MRNTWNIVPDGERHPIPPNRTAGPNETLPASRARDTGRSQTGILLLESWQPSRLVSWSGLLLRDTQRPRVCPGPYLVRYLYRVTHPNVNRCSENNRVLYRRRTADTSEKLPGGAWSIDSRFGPSPAGRFACFAIIDSETGAGMIQEKQILPPCHPCPTQADDHVTDSQVSGL